MSISGVDFYMPKPEEFYGDKPYSIETISLDEPIIQFTVIKYQPELYNGIRECVYYKSLDHPNIIKTYDCEFIRYRYNRSNRMFGKKPTRLYPLIVGEGLKITFPRYVSIDALENIPTAGVEKLFEQVASALSYLEDNDVLQSDVKPENIFYDRSEDKFILADFDLSFDSLECFANRVATPTTIPPELMQDTYTLTTNKGDIFSLGVTISTVLVGKWYHMYNEKYDEVTYNDVLKNMLLLLNNVPFRYKDELIACLDYDYTRRPTCKELTDRLGVRTVYPPVRREHVDTYGLYSQLVDEFRSFARTTPLVRSLANTIPLVVRPEHIANIVTTFFSTKQFNPDTTSYYKYACAGLLLSSIMCMSNPVDLSEIIKAYINKFPTGTRDEGDMYYTIIDICESLDFKLLFVR